MRLHEAGQGLSVFLRMQPRLTFGTWRMAARGLDRDLPHGPWSHLTTADAQPRVSAPLSPLHAMPSLGLLSLPSAARVLDLHRILDI